MNTPISKFDQDAAHPSREEVQQKQTVVWDPLVRVFHWSLVSAFFIAYFTEDDLLDLHVYAGYLDILLRVCWFLG